jgi:hypothetical protein
LFHEALQLLTSKKITLRLLINKNRSFCYRICHIQNLPHILRTGLCTKHHPNANAHYVSIGNPQIITTRDTTPVKIAGYGNLGEYVPFYFTPRSIMLYNIITGYWAPVVPKVAREDILVIECAINRLAELSDFFFTDGQANDALTNHYNDLSDSNKIDWNNIQGSNFSKSDGDFDRPRRYQAEFLVHNYVPLDRIESFHIYNKKAATFVQNELKNSGIGSLPVHVTAEYFF